MEWTRACDLDKRDARFARKVCGSIKYIKLTPPRLREEVTFVRGENLSNGFTFTARELPTKNVIRSRGNKRIACAILVSWTAKKESGTDFLLALLIEAGINVYPYRRCDSPVQVQQNIKTNIGPSTCFQNNDEVSPDTNSSLCEMGHRSSGIASKATNSTPSRQARL